MIGNLIAACEQLCFDYLKDEYVEAFVKACTDGKFKEAREVCEMTYISIKDLCTDAVKEKGFSIYNVMTKVIEGGHVDILDWLVGKFNLDPSTTIGSTLTHCMSEPAFGNHLALAERFVHHFKPTKHHALSCLSSIAGKCSGGNLEYVSWFVKEFNISRELFRYALINGFDGAVLWVLENYEDARINSNNSRKIVAVYFSDNGLAIIQALHERFGFELDDFEDCSFENNLPNQLDKCLLVVQWMIDEFNLDEEYVVERIRGDTHHGPCQNACECREIASEFVYPG